MKTYLVINETKTGIERYILEAESPGDAITTQLAEEMMMGTDDNDLATIGVYELSKDYNLLEDIVNKEV